MMHVALAVVIYLSGLVGYVAFVTIKKLEDNAPSSEIMYISGTPYKCTRVTP